MDKTLYFDFGTSDLASSAVVQGGYLSFLPPSNHYKCADDLQYSYFELEHVVLLEIRGTAPDLGIRLNLLNAHIGMWQLYQFLNHTEIFLPHSMLLTDNRGMTLASRATKVPLRMQAGKQWVLCIGYKQEIMPLLMEEYGNSLQDLHLHLSDENSFHYRDVDFAIGHRFREVFEQLQKMEYKPFSGRAELGIILSKLLSLYCQQFQPHSQSYLSIYHRALEYIREHAEEKITRQQIADALCISTRTLNRAFEGRPFKIAEYIQQVKLNKAREILFTETKSVDTVAGQLHYTDRYHFSKVFKKHLVHTPQQVKTLRVSYEKSQKKS